VIVFEDIFGSNLQIELPSSSEDDSESLESSLESELLDFELLEELSLEDFDSDDSSSLSFFLITNWFK